MAVINGTNFPDVIPITETQAALDSLAGNDVISGLDSNDGSACEVMMDYEATGNEAL